MKAKHEINQRIIELIKGEIGTERGGKARFCRVTGISDYILTRILNGQGTVTGDTWQALCAFFPELRPKRINLCSNNRAGRDNNFFTSNNLNFVLEQISDEVMSLDLADEVKVKIYNIIKGHKQK